jgi:DNA-binding transcriptional LysR family regulator
MELSPAILSLLNRLRGRHLALVVALHEERSLHKAARVISTSQPAATKMLREIESIFGVPLFERLPRSTVPTELGEAVAAFARTAIVDLRHLREDLEAVRTGGRGHVIVGAIMAAVPTVLGGAMTRLRSRYPGVTVDVRVDTSDYLVRELAAGNMDVVLGRVADEESRALMAWERLQDERLRIVCGPRNALRRQKRVSLKKVAGCAWVLQALPSPMRQLLDREFHDAGLKPAVVAAQTPSILATVAMLRDTDLLAVMPDTVAADFEDQGKIVGLPIRLRRSLEPYGIVTRKGRAVPAPARFFIEAVREAARA